MILCLRWLCLHHLLDAHLFVSYDPYKFYYIVIFFVYSLLLGFKTFTSKHVRVLVGVTCGGRNMHLNG